MTKAEQVHQRVDALVAEGVTKADAFRELSEELGQPVKSLQGAYYQHARKGTAGSSRPRKRETTTADAIADATATLEKALEHIDREVETAKERADEAKAEYDALKSSANERKAAITAKIEALKS
jgi:polyhydroxyalkanoate synthesis regulator phasin